MSTVTIIFPNRRAGVFLRKAFSELIDKPVLLPEISSLEDYLLNFSTLKKIESLEAVFELFEANNELHQNAESLDKFFFWGEMILRDFEEIDQYLVNASHLFKGIKTQKELDEAFFFLDEEEKEVIQSFWTTFLPDSTDSQKLFLETWKILLPLYKKYKEKLRQKGLGYGGMIYRDIAEHIDEIKFNPSGKIYLAGFNALTHSEEVIIKHFIKEYGAEMVWDIDDYYYSNKQQEAGTFFRRYSKDTLLGRSFNSNMPSRINERKEITATGVSLEVGQAKSMGEHLSEITSKQDFDPSKTVIVLPQEHMLFPTLHALPDSVDKINITMGYPLRATSVYSLLESLIDLQRLKKISASSGLYFYYKPVLSVLQHPLIISMEKSKIVDFLSHIKQNNQINIYEKELPFEGQQLKNIFGLQTDPLQYLTQILNGLISYWSDDEHAIELKFMVKFKEYLDQLSRMLGDKAQELKYDFFSSLFKKIVRSLKVPFTGEPLEGLQIMGILETRNLDFENVYILNMNEGSWPATPRKGSFIPFNIRKAFHLPVYENNDAIYSYLFYRLLQRSKKVHFFYNTVSEFNINGELSRLVKQLELESNHDIRKFILANPISTSTISAININKTPEVLRVMDRYLEGYQKDDASKITASGINTYLDCKLRFYFKYVAKLYEPNTVDEELDPMVFGNVLHNTMEIIYGDYISEKKQQLITQEVIDALKESIHNALILAFMKHYNIKAKDRLHLEGRSLIAFEILLKICNRILDLDKKYAPFEIIGLESGKDGEYIQKVPIEVNGNKKDVRIHGIIDRIDKKDDVVRIIDYKTGRDDRIFYDLESLIDRESNKRNKAVFQVFLYSYLYWKKNDSSLFIQPGIFNNRELFDEEFDHRVIQKEGRATNTVFDFKTLAVEYESLLKEILVEIYDPEVPFSQTEDEKKCEYCPYKDLCSR